MQHRKYIIADRRLDKTENIGLIFIHGAGGCSHFWNEQLEGLSSKIKVIAINLPGHLEAECSDLPSMASYVVFIDELISELNLETVILAGHSMGGAVVMSYYLQNPEKIHGLILIGTGARLRVLPMILNTIKTNYPEYIKFSRNFAFHKSSIKECEEIISEIEKYMGEISPKIAHQDFTICNEFDIIEQLPKIKVPTLIIVGDADQLTPVKYSTYMHKAIENSEIYVIKDAGHMVMLEKSQEVNEIILNFLNRI